MFRKITLKQYSILAIGAFIMGMGIGGCNYANLGVDPMSVFVTGLLKYIPLSFGVVNFLVGLSQLALGITVKKENITLATFVSMAFCSFGIDGFNLLGLKPVASPFNYFWLAAGFFLYCLGIAITQLPKCGYTAFDCAVFALIHLLKKEYHVIRWIIDLSYLVIGVLIGGKIGLCTIIVLLFAGKMVEFFVAKLDGKIEF